jgi:hypothetical protein
MFCFKQKMTRWREREHTPPTQSGHTEGMSVDILCFSRAEMNHHSYGVQKEWEERERGREGELERDFRGTYSHRTCVVD